MLRKPAMRARCPRRRRAPYADGMFDRRGAPKWVDGSLRCSFCGKPKPKVEQLVAGPGVYICNECVKLCNDIVEDERTPSR